MVEHLAVNEGAVGSSPTRGAMENPKKNENTAKVFARYLEEKFSWKAKVVMPTKINNPLWDASLEISGAETLLLQLKQNIKFVSSENILTKSKSKIFQGAPTEDVIRKAENKYKDNAENLILILHKDDGISMPWDAEIKNKRVFNTKFRGVYMVSPEQILYGPEPHTIKEFVSEIKNAFSDCLIEF